MKRRSFLKTVACLSAAVAVPFKDILAAPPVRGPKVVLRLYWRAVGNGIPLSWQSQPLGSINVGKNQGMVITGIGMKAKDLRLPKTTDHVEFVLSRDTKLEEVMRDALVGDQTTNSFGTRTRGTLPLRPPEASSQDKCKYRPPFSFRSSYTAARLYRGLDSNSHPSPLRLF